MCKELFCPICKSSNIYVTAFVITKMRYEDYESLNKKAYSKKTTTIKGTDKERTILVCGDCGCKMRNDDFSALLSSIVKAGRNYSTKATLTLSISSATAYVIVNTKEGDTVIGRVYSLSGFSDNDIQHVINKASSFGITVDRRK